MTMDTSSEITDLVKALAAAQKLYEPIGKDKTAKVGTYSYDYADLAAVLEAVRPALNGQGIAIVQAAHAEAQIVTVETRLCHVSGQWIGSTLTVEAETAAPQKLGSAISYARRYGLLALAGVAPQDEDDDGAAAHHERPPPQPKRPAAAPEPKPDGVPPPKPHGPPVHVAALWNRIKAAWPSESDKRLREATETIGLTTPSSEWTVADVNRLSLVLWPSPL
jgi:hypothetical protein